MTRKLTKTDFMKRILSIALLLGTSSLFGQNVELQIFQKASTATTAQVGFRVRTITNGSTVDFIGVTFYMLYQSLNAVPQSVTLNSVIGVDDSRLTTTFAWGTSARNTNPQQTVSIDPGAPGGQVYNRRYIYGNVDEAGGTNIRTLTNAWDTLLYITVNTLQVTYPQGGYAYEQGSAESSGGVALTDPTFTNIPITVTTLDIPLGPPVVTPVIFTYFNANCNDKGALLTWETATEENADYYEVQRSGNGSDWKTVDKVDASGNSAIARQYQYLDLEGGNVQYRLRQVDIDGKATYTNIRSTSCEGKSFSSTLYPVPARDKITLVVRSDRAATTNLQILDMNGRAVKQLRTNINNGNTNIIIDVNSLPQGEYMLMSTDPSVRINKKFVIAR
jgi:hypothetical protein